MHATGTFAVEAFDPIALDSDEFPQTATPVAVAIMHKRFSGEVSGMAATLFNYALDSEGEKGGYVAMEAFRGSLHERSGAFNFMHSATTSGSDRADESLVIVPSSGTGALAGIVGTGGITVDADGTHQIWFEYGLPS